MIQIAPGDAYATTVAYTFKLLVDFSIHIILCIASTTTVAYTATLVFDSHYLLGTLPLPKSVVAQILDFSITLLLMSLPLLPSLRQLKSSSPHWFLELDCSWGRYRYYMASAAKVLIDSSIHDAP